MWCTLCSLQGRIKVNKDKGELNLLVEVNAKTQGSKGVEVKDLKQLSGGRSYVPCPCPSDSFVGTAVLCIMTLGHNLQQTYSLLDQLGGCM